MAGWHLPLYFADPAPSMTHMGGNLDHSDFVDPDYEPGRRTVATPMVSAIGSSHSTQRAPSREEINQQVTAAQQALVQLKQKQEELERERAQLEEARRRRLEYEQGREEMLAHLTRGIGLLDEAEQAARRDAEQLSRTLADLRAAQEKVAALQESAWSAENYASELTRALTTLENARMEWNSARLKWPVLGNDPAAHPTDAARGPGDTKLAGLENRAPSDLARLGLALTWPVALAVLAVGIILALVLSRR